jgi:hypothetical protein
MSSIRYHRYSECDPPQTVFAVSITDREFVNARRPRFLIFWRMVRLAWACCWQRAPR